jgi:hydroxymethylpyrimidine/phosphomethylpyrimidine kinase
MGHVVPDRFFWALPEAEGQDEDGTGAPESPPEDGPDIPRGSRRIH